MVPAVDATVTRLVVSALDASGISDKLWREQFKIGASRLSHIRAGRAALTDAELEQISRATGEPWYNLVLSLLGSADEVTADTRDLLTALHSLAQSASVEAQERGKQNKHFRALRQLVLKRSQRATSR